MTSTQTFTTTAAPAADIAADRAGSILITPSDSPGSSKPEPTRADRIDVVGPITAERMYEAFGTQIDRSVLISAPSSSAVVSTRDNRVDRVAADAEQQQQRQEAVDNALEGYDAEQTRLMAEDCIILDENDKVIGSGSKKLCHIRSNIAKGLLHRAFSVFLFDQDNRLLLQQRASEKITFPDMWTNTCCSHPLAISGEMGLTLEDSIIGVKRAAQRKLEHELGIPKEQIPLEEFVFVTRIHYRSPCDEKWGEHEVDYILLVKPSRKITLDVNPNEVRATAFISSDELNSLFTTEGAKRMANEVAAPPIPGAAPSRQMDSIVFTPWFRLIVETDLYSWWKTVKNECLQGESLVELNECVAQLVEKSEAGVLDKEDVDSKYNVLLKGVTELRRLGV